jgi:RNA polymerase sigma-70 factor (ECF subfamily)
MIVAEIDHPRPAALFSPRPMAYAREMEQIPDDGVLMLRYRDGDARSFEVLYQRHNDALYRYLLRLCYDRDIADDLFQDAWGKVIKARDSYQPTAGFRTFLFRVAHNCFIDYLRRNRRHQAQVQLDPDTQPGDADDPEQETERALARRRLDSALRAIPAEQRDVFLLHEEAHLTLEQIAAVTGVNKETAKSRLRYAVRKLHNAIDAPVSIGNAASKIADRNVDCSEEAV